MLGTVENCSKHYRLILHCTLSQILNMCMYFPDSISILELLSTVTHYIMSCCKGESLRGETSGTAEKGEEEMFSAKWF